MRWLVLLLMACEPVDPCAEGGLVASPEGLVVTEAEHGEGWQRPDCEACHALSATHRVVCTEQIDAEALRAEVEAEGYDGCASCHGANGGGP